MLYLLPEFIKILTVTQTSSRGRGVESHDGEGGGKECSVALHDASVGEDVMVGNKLAEYL